MVYDRPSMSLTLFFFARGIAVMNVFMVAMGVSFALGFIGDKLLNTDVYAVALPSIMLGSLVALMFNIYGGNVFAVRLRYGVSGALGSVLVFAIVLLVLTVINIDLDNPVGRIFIIYGNSVIFLTFILCSAITDNTIISLANIYFNKGRNITSNVIHSIILLLNLEHGVYRDGDITVFRIHTPKGIKEIAVTEIEEETIFHSEGVVADFDNKARKVKIYRRYVNS